MVVSVILNVKNISRSFKIMKCFTKIISKSDFATTAFKSHPTVEPVNLAYKTYAGTEADNGTPPLIIMHGLFGSKKNWHSICQNLKEKLRPRRKIIAIDARNHGDSPHSPYHTYEHLAQDVAEFLKQQSIQSASVLGHSMGGRVMLYLALKYPNLVDRAIVVDITPIGNIPWSQSLYDVLSVMKSIQLPPDLSEGDARKKIAQELQKIITNTAFINFLLLNLKKLYNGGFAWRINIDALKSNMDNISKFPQDILNSQQYRGPVLLIAGTQSDFVQSSEVPTMQKSFPNTTVNWIDCGHLIHFEKPDEFLTAVVNFLSYDLI